MKKLGFCFALAVLFFSGCQNPQVSTPEPLPMPQDSKKYCDDTNFQLACPQEGDKIAVLETNYGIIKFKLFPNEAPETVKNFEKLANDDKYNNTIFHRVIKDFMIQGGDFEKRNGAGGYSYQGPGTSIPDEFTSKLTHGLLAVSMANAGPGTGGSQFFIVHNTAGAYHLDNRHTVFGQVFYGGDVVNRIASLPTNPDDKPLEDAIIKKAEVIDFQP